MPGYQPCSCLDLVWSQKCSTEQPCSQAVSPTCTAAETVTHAGVWTLQCCWLIHGFTEPITLSTHKVQAKKASTNHVTVLCSPPVGQPEHGRVFVEPLVEDTSLSGFNFDNPNPTVTPLLGE